MERVDGRETGYMNETSLITGFQVPRQHCGRGQIWGDHVGLPLLPTQMKIILFMLPKQSGSRSCICNLKLSLLFFYCVCSSISFMFSFIFFLKVKLLLFFIYKDVLKSHLEALKVFLPEASYRYIKSTHFTNEND